MTLDKAIETLKKMYEAALKMPFVFDPLAWALRGTWKLYLALPNSTISMFQVQDAPDANAGDTVSKKAVELALLEKGQSSKRYKVGDNWELNFGEIREALATVPPAQPEQRWIPCSERLPEEGHDVLITKEPLKIKGYEQEVIKAKRSVDPRSGKIEWWSEFGALTNKAVLAWMPMPEPYKEGDE